MSGLKALADKHPLIGDVRGRGLMIGVELVRDRQTKERATDERDAVVTAAFARGLLMLGAGKNAIRFSPPLVLTREQADMAVRIFDEALTEVEADTTLNAETAEHAEKTCLSACSARLCVDRRAAGAGVAGLWPSCRAPGRSLGKTGEDLACRELERRGYAIVAGATGGAVANWTSSPATARRWCSSR